MLDPKGDRFPLDAFSTSRSPYGSFGFGTDEDYARVRKRYYTGPIMSMRL